MNSGKETTASKERPRKILRLLFNFPMIRHSTYRFVGHILDILHVFPNRTLHRSIFQRILFISFCKTYIKLNQYIRYIIRYIRYISVNNVRKRISSIGSDVKFSMDSSALQLGRMIHTVWTINARTDKWQSRIWSLV